jgi:hypothetical protein
VRTGPWDALWRNAQGLTPFAPGCVLVGRHAPIRLGYLACKHTRIVGLPRGALRNSLA